MTRFTNNRSRLGGLLVAALAALAIVALPGLASARDDSSSSDSTTTIKSFDETTRTLVLSLPDGETLSGVVAGRTRIRCEDQSDHRRGHHEIRGREAEPGDDHGGRGEEAGDDNGGGREAEPGDDRGGHGGESGDDNGGDSSGPSGSGSGGHDDNGHGANCSVADLVPGATVDEVEVDFEHGGVRFDEIELTD